MENVIEITENDFDYFRNVGMLVNGASNVLVENNHFGGHFFIEPSDHGDFIYVNGTNNGIYRGNTLLLSYTGGKIFQGIFFND